MSELCRLSKKSEPLVSLYPFRLQANCASLLPASLVASIRSALAPRPLGILTLRERFTRAAGFLAPNPSALRQ